MLVSKFCKNNVFSQSIIALLGLIITLRAFFPGLITSDSLDQYQQATSFIFSDWHPPMMSFIWALTNDWIPGPFGMLLLDCILYWGALLLLSISIPAENRKISIAVMISGFMPFTVNALSHIGKDVLQAVVWLFAVGVITVLYSRGEIRKKYLILSVVLLFIGNALRFNAIFGLLPLVWLLLQKINISAWRKWLIILIIFPLLTILSTAAFNYGFLHASKSRVYQSLVVFDIGGISHFSGKDYFGESWGNNESEKVITSCYEPKAWDTYAWGSCSFVLNKLQQSGSWTDGSLMKKWIFSLAHEPGAYLRHRYENYMEFLWHPNAISDEQMVSNAYGFKYEMTGLFRTLQMSIKPHENMFVFKPGFWLMASLIFSIYGLFMRKEFYRDVFIALNLSSLLYLLGYFFVGVASEFRYAYWSILATTASFPFILLSLKLKK
ncbi:hypothetical protein ACT3RT_14260 [Ewingella sp. AOP9-I1-14]